MTQDDEAQRIALLDERIEQLAAHEAGCAKAMTLARGLVGVGGLWFALIVAGVFSADPVGLMAAIAALLGGIVLFGSNRSTLLAVRASREDAQDERELRAGMSGPGFDRLKGGRTM